MKGFSNLAWFVPDAVSGFEKVIRPMTPCNVVTGVAVYQDQDSSTRQCVAVDK